MCLCCRDVAVGRVLDPKARGNTDVSLIPQCSKGFSSFGADSCTEFVQSMCNHLHQHLHACSEFEALAFVLLSGYTKILQTLTGMGSAALVAAVALAR